MNTTVKQDFALSVLWVWFI